MNKISISIIACVLLMSNADRASAQPQGALEELQRQLERMKDQFDELRRSHQEQVESLQRQIDALKADSNAPPPVGGEQPMAVPAPSGAGAEAASASSISPGRSLTDPIRLWSGDRGYMKISLDGLFAAGTSTADDLDALQLGGHDPKARGFTVQNLELTLDGAVDPYFTGQANLIFQIDSEGESAFELEEAFLTTSSLPGRLQVKAGQYFTEFGRQNPTHPHTWHFADTPLVNGRFFGEDGLRNPGARVSWLAPTPFYTELFFGMQNSHGETAHSFRSDHEEEFYLGRLHEAGEVNALEDLLFTPRIAASFDLSDTQTLLLGASGAFGPNSSGPDADTRIYGLDLTWKWTPVNQQGGFPFVLWQTEGMWRRFDAAAFSADLDGDGAVDVNLPGETLDDYGWYSQILYGFKRGWVAGLRGDYVNGDAAAFGADPDRDRRWRLSPNLTWYPSEFSKIRLQYNYDDREFIGSDHSVWIQYEFMLGDHAAHQF